MTGTLIEDALIFGLPRMYLIMMHCTHVKDKEAHSSSINYQWNMGHLNRQPCPTHLNQGNVYLTVWLILVMILMIHQPTQLLSRVGSGPVKLMYV